MPDDREPVRTAADLDTLDDDEIREGYMDAADPDLSPGGNRSRSYWHGWRNGRVDRRLAEPDDAMRELVSDVQRNGGVLRQKGQTGPDMRRQARLARDARDQTLSPRARREARRVRRDG